MIAIAKGWAFKFLSDIGLSPEKVETLALERLNICDKCPYVDKENNKCGDCKCPLEAKVRGSSYCPKNYW